MYLTQNLHHPDIIRVLDKISTEFYVLYALPGAPQSNLMATKARDHAATI